MKKTHVGADAIVIVGPYTAVLQPQAVSLSDVSNCLGDCCCQKVYDNGTILKQSTIAIAILQQGRLHTKKHNNYYYITASNSKRLIRSFFPGKPSVRAGIRNDQTAQPILSAP